MGSASVGSAVVSIARYGILMTSARGADRAEMESACAAGFPSVCAPAPREVSLIILDPLPACK